MQMQLQEPISHKIVSTQIPHTPIRGSTYFDHFKQCTMVYDGFDWMVLSLDNPNEKLAPTDTQLEKYQSLKSVWNEYLVVRKLLGIQ